MFIKIAYLFRVIPDNTIAIKEWTDPYLVLVNTESSIFISEASDNYFLNHFVKSNKYPKDKYKKDLNSVYKCHHSSDAPEQNQ